MKKLKKRKHVRKFLHAFSFEKRGVDQMNPRTIEALEETRDQLFNAVERKVATKYETVKDSVKEEVLDGVRYYLRILVERMSQDDYADPNFENSVDYQLVHSFENYFWDWFNETFSERRINEMNEKAN